MVDLWFVVLLSMLGGMIIIYLLIKLIRQMFRRLPALCPHCNHIHCGICLEQNTKECPSCGHHHNNKEFCGHVIGVKQVLVDGTESKLIEEEYEELEEVIIPNEKIDKPQYDLRPVKKTRQLYKDVPIGTQTINELCQCSRKLYYCPCVLQRTGLFYMHVNSMPLEHDREEITFIMPCPEPIHKLYVPLLSNPAFRRDAEKLEQHMIL